MDKVIVIVSVLGTTDTISLPFLPLLNDTVTIELVVMPGTLASTDVTPSIVIIPEIRLSNLSWCVVLIKPAIEFVASAMTTLFPSEELIVIWAAAVVDDKFVETLVSFAVFAAISSNKPGDNKPETDVVAIGIMASVPSEDSIVLAPVVPLILKSVLTFVVFAVFAVMADD